MTNATVNSDHGFSEARVDDWQNTKALLRKFPLRWIFRGQSKAGWLLVTSLERATGWAPGFFTEDLISQQFRSQASNYLISQSLPKDTLEWWALMQHHGAPTRLLDWTESAYIAAFFALDEAYDEYSVWAIDRVWCRNTAVEIAKNTMRNNNIPEETVEKIQVETITQHFDQFFLPNRFSFVFPVKPDNFNVRLAIQQGLFLCPASVNTTFMQNLLALGTKDELQRRLVRINFTLAGATRANALQDLNYMNINQATLFPGLGGFAHSLKNQIIILRDMTDPVSDMATVDGFPFDA